MFAGQAYTAAALTLEPGESLVLYSDGITEAESASGRAFGREALERVVASHADSPPFDIVRRIEDEVRTFSAAPGHVDDRTMAVLRRSSAMLPT